jgi:hypothetical protein
MSNRLLVNPGTPEAWAIELKPGVNRIGRGTDNNFTINHGSISTQHCEFTVTDDGVLLKDLGSTNGTFVERVPVTQLKLYHGQHVQLGAVDMIFESKGLPVLPDAVNLPGDGAKIMVANPSPAAPPPPVPSGLRINRPEVPVGQPPMAPSVPVSGFRPAGRNAAGPASGSSGLSNQQILIRGSIGAVVGAFVGMLAWYFITKFTGYSFKLVALGVGAVTGGVARLLAKDGSLGLGFVCGVCALLAILLGDYFGVRALFLKEFDKYVAIGDLAYEAQMEYAKAAVAARTPEEIRKLIAENEEKTPAEVTEAEIAEFQKDLPELKDFAAGKVTKSEFRQKLNSAALDEFSYKEYFLQGNIKGSVFTILFICLGVVTAWKMGAGDAAAS